MFYNINRKVYNWCCYIFVVVVFSWTELTIFFSVEFAKLISLRCSVLPIGSRFGHKENVWCEIFCVLGCWKDNGGLWINLPI